MKKIITFLFSIAVIISANAQLPHEFGRFKKAAQIEETTADHDLVIKIAKDGAFILYQSYQLEDSIGKFFGLSGNKEFGAENTLALKVKNGYLIYDIARVPWDYSCHYAKLKKRYKPVLFPSQYSDLSLEARYDSIYFDTQGLVTIYPEQIYGMKADAFFNDGFSVAHKTGKSEGFLVWFIQPLDMDMSSSTNLDIIVHKHKMNIVEDRSKEYPIVLPQTNGTIMGGMYVIPELSSVGRLDFIINGITIGSKEEWRLVCPFTNTDNIFTTTPVAIEYDKEFEIELTPNDIKK